MPKQSRKNAWSVNKKWVSDSSHRSNIVSILSQKTKTLSHCGDKIATSSAFVEVEKDCNHHFVSADDKVFFHPFPNVDPCDYQFVYVLEFVPNTAGNTPEISRVTKSTIPGKSHFCVRTAHPQIGSCQNHHASHQSSSPMAMDTTPPDRPTHENAAAVGPRNGAENVYEAGQLPANNTASLATRHPIIALHWGIVV